MHSSRLITPVAAAALFAFGVAARPYLGSTASAQKLAPVSATKAAESHASLVEDLSAKEAIRNQIYNYSRGLDRMDKELALQVWHADGTADYGGKVTTGAEFVEGAFRMHSTILSHTHHMIDTIIKVNGDKAVSETYANSSLVYPLNEQLVQGVMVRPKGMSVSLIRGRYADRWSKRDGHWAIDHRVYVEDFRTVQELPGMTRLGRGTRDRTDPSYAVYPQ